MNPDCPRCGSRNCMLEDEDHDAYCYQCGYRIYVKKPLPYITRGKTGYKFTERQVSRAQRQLGHL